MRWTGNRLLVSIIFVVFTVAGALMVVFADRGGRIIGLATLAMFGVGGLAWWIGEFQTERAATPRVRRVPLRPGVNSRALVLPVRAGKQRTAVIVLAAVAVGALIIALSPEPLGRRDGPVARALMFGVGVLLGLFALRGLRAWRRGDYYLALTPAGITSRMIGGAFTIPWQSVTAMRTYSINDQPFLGLSVTSENDIQGDDVLGALDRVERHLTGNDRSIWLGGFSATPDAVADLVRHYLDSPAERASIGAGPVPTVLSERGTEANFGYTSAESGQLRSLGRWVPALLLTVYGLFMGVVLLEVIGRILVPGSELARGPIRSAIAIAFVAILSSVAVAHVGAAVAIARKREIGRRVGLGLSVAGICIGLVGAVIGVATAAPQRSWTLVVVTLVAYSLSLIGLWLIGDLSRLSAKSSEDDIKARPRA